MNFLKKVNFSLIFAIVFFVISMLVSTIPCQKAPSTPNPEYSWKTCTLNPDTYQNFEGNLLYLGYTTSLAETYVLVLAISFFIPLLILTLIGHKKK
jgi:preprotein translocase subunit SecG